MRVKDAVGRFGEDVAAQHLLAAGLQILERNWRCREGELDIVARDGSELVFVEVKTRSSLAFGTPAEAVGPAKAARLRRLALCWLAEHRELRPVLGRASASTSSAWCGTASSASRSSTCAGCSDGAGARPRGRADRIGRAAGRGRVRHLERAARPVVHRAGRHVGGRVARPAAGGHLATPAPTGRTGRSRSRCCRPTSARQVRASTWRSGSRCSPRPGRSRPPASQEAVWIAELGLDGRLRPVRGVLPVGARRPAPRGRAGRGRRGPTPPRPRWSTGSTSGRRTPSPRSSAWLTGSGPPLPAACSDPVDPGEPGGADLADVAGQATAKRALEIAAAGGHHLYLVGSPGAGKTMLAERLPGLLPAAVRRGGARGHRRALGRRAAARPGPAGAPGAVAGAAPHRVGGRAGRRRRAPRPAGRDQPGAPRRAVPRRGAGVPAAGARRVAPAAGVRPGGAAPRRRGRQVPGPVPAGAGREPVRLRQAGPRLRLRRPRRAAATRSGCPGR